MRSPPGLQSFLGSAQESDEGCILGGFLKNDVFGSPGMLHTRFRRNWAELAALLWKWSAEGERKESVA
jgi:hypothetical protein